MPPKTAKQRRFMAMLSTTKGRKKARGKGPSKAVARKILHHKGKK
jgi:hypothetical protein